MIQQFLFENNLHSSLKALQSETGIYTNIAPPSLKSNIKNGDWIKVLDDLLLMNLEAKTLIPLYEHIVLELIERKETEAARVILRQTEPMEILRNENSDHYIYLEGLVSRLQIDWQKTYQGTKEDRRIEIVENLSKYLTSVDSGRLLILLGQSLKWQVSQGLLNPDSGYNLFQGKADEAKEEEDRIISHSYRRIVFPKKQHPESICFSPNGKYFCIGTFDGFLEVWDYFTGKIRKDLIYQQNVYRY